MNMHNLTKISLFRILLRITYPFSLLVLYPLALLKKKNPDGLFFFFDRYAIGGAQRIHIDILRSVQEAAKQVYFTRKSPNDRLKTEFYSIPHARSWDIHLWCDNLLFRLFTVHYYCFYINRHKNARVLGANSTFFYDMLPFLGVKATTIELLHNFTFGSRGMEFFGLANHRYLDIRIVYDSFTLSNIKEQYRQFQVDSTYLDRILFIEPGVDIPAPPVKGFDLPLRILYAGRGGLQKRIHLLNRIVEKSLSLQLPVEFHFAGSMTSELSDLVKGQCIIHGEISSPAEMQNLYAMADIILLVSSYEGFPMFIKEGMAAGCVPVVTPLPGNRMHLKDGENALLISVIEPEDQVVASALECIGRLTENPDMLRYLSGHAYQYASLHFTKTAFEAAYQKLLLSGESLPLPAIHNRISP